MKKYKNYISAAEKDSKLRKQNQYQLVGIYIFMGALILSVLIVVSS